MRTRKPAETRKQEIVDAALRLADSEGPERLSTETVAEAVGLTQPGIFRHFPKKQDLWEAVARRIGTMMEASRAFCKTMRCQRISPPASARVAAVRIAIRAIFPWLIAMATWWR